MADPLSDYWTHDGRFGVRIDRRAIELIVAECVRSGRRETGGILVGRYSDDRRLALVQSASSPPPDTRAGGFWLLRGVRGLQSWLEGLWKKDGTYYLGEWHFHPFASPTPSRQDVSQMKRIAATESYQCAEPILLIIGGDPHGAWKLHVEVHTRRGERNQLTMQPDPNAVPRKG